MTKLAEKHNTQYYATLDLPEVEMTEDLDEETLSAARHVIAEIVLRKAVKQKTNPRKLKFQLKTVLCALGLDDPDEEYVQREKTVQSIMGHQFKEKD